MLGSCLETILASPEVQQQLEAGQQAEAWVEDYLTRVQFMQSPQLR
jgi:hypothetical protein